MQKKINFLKQFRIFSKLSNIKLSKIIYNMGEIKQINKGQVIFKEKEKIDGLWLIVSGEFEVSRLVKTKPAIDDTSSHMSKKIHIQKA